MGWFGPSKPKPPVDPSKPRGGLAGSLDRVRAGAQANRAAEAASLLANTAPVAPPPTSLIASTHVDLARAAADRMRKRTGGGLLGGPGGVVTPGPKAKLKAKTLIGAA